MRGWAIALVLALVLLSGGLVMLDLEWMSEQQRPWADALARAFSARGLSPRWAIALGLTETGMRPLVNRSGTDGARGGSWGPTQISAKTARAWGYQGPMEDLTTDPELAATLTADMVAAGFAERGGRVYYYGVPSSPERLAAVWNAGRLETDPDLPASTRNTYLPTFQAHLARV